MLTDEEYIAADVNGDRKLDSTDATAILQYYTYISTGGTDPFEYFYADSLIN